MLSHMGPIQLKPSNLRVCGGVCVWVCDLCVWAGMTWHAEAFQCPKTLQIIVSACLLIFFLLSLYLLLSLSRAFESIPRAFECVSRAFESVSSLMSRILCRVPCYHC